MACVSLPGDVGQGSYCGMRAAVDIRTVSGDTMIRPPRISPLRFLSTTDVADLRSASLGSLDGDGLSLSTVGGGSSAVRRPW